MDENEFYRQATLQILSSLDLSKGRCLSYLSLTIPVECLPYYHTAPTA